ncbi:MAG: XRE family transcriptional regulator [Treponema sp.]|jgi:putative transcriptional regulator|nr:XRE family transcriptional regulator [Treponema sp.]
MKKYKSPIFKHIHQEATDRFEAGAITAEEMRRYDASCMVSPSDVPRGRAASIPVMAATSSGSQGKTVK